MTEMPAHQAVQPLALVDVTTSTLHWRAVPTEPGANRDDVY